MVYLTPLGVMLLTGALCRDSTELWLLRLLGVKNSLRMYWAWWKAIRHTPNREKLEGQETGDEDLTASGRRRSKSIYSFNYFIADRVVTVELKWRFQSLPSREDLIQTLES